ncbi:MAG TPA: SdrD B-like domain-containing protein [Candidatus Sulfomarinibacteraceae bacterium]|nr:SdrD B-like domain-containing protein [Candidatus Sulfomarinibacteraceae bacterium]
MGDPGYDPSCFRLIRTTGVLTVSRSGGQSDLIIPFEDQLYFTNLPEDNTGAVGQVHYAFLALDGPCSTRLTPYQEVASGADNEKFNADFGSGIPPVGSYEPSVTVEKRGDPPTVKLNGTIVYHIPLHNEGDGSAGLPMESMPLVISDTLPAGTDYLGGSASADGNVTLLYSTDGGQTWSSEEPADPTTVTTLRWQLDEPLDPGQIVTASFEVQVPVSYDGPALIENKACAAYGDGACFYDAQTTTMVSGDNQLGDYIWHDVDGDGLQDSGESPLEGVAVNLYWDATGDGVLGDDDIFLTATESDANGTYLFDNLPDGEFLVVVDALDPDLPYGYVTTTPDSYAVDLDTAGESAGQVTFMDADFGFSPVLGLQKSQQSVDPLYEGRDVVYNINLLNTLPGDGSGQAGSCKYVTWAETEASQSTSQPANKRFTNSVNVFGPDEPDDVFAFADFRQGANNVVAGTDFGLGIREGTITHVEALFRVYIDSPLTNDYAQGTLFYNDAQVGTSQVFSTAELNTMVGAANADFVIWDITVLRTWEWADFAANLDLQFGLVKEGSNDPSVLYIDALGLRVTADDACGGAEGTILTLPVTDTFDASELEFVSALPAPSSVSNGVISWDNLGPLHAGGQKQVTVTFRALEPPDSNPMSVTNFAQASGTMRNGAPANEAAGSAESDILPAGSIGGVVWNDNGASGSESGNGVQDGDEQGIHGVTVYLYEDGNGDGLYTPGEDTLLQTTTTDKDGYYLFEGVADGQYVVVVDTFEPPADAFVQTGDPDEVFNNQTAAVLNNSDGDPHNDDLLDLYFGYQTPNYVFGTVWQDYDGNAVQDAGDAGLAGWIVELVDGSCTPGIDCDTTTTDAQGAYHFANLPDGAYQIRVHVPGGEWEQTLDPDDTLDSETDELALSGGNAYGSYDFAYRRSGSLSIGDQVYHDWNGNGVQDSGEEGITGVTVALYADVDGNGLYDAGVDPLIDSATTDANGQYLFEGLVDGDYVVVVSEGDLPGLHQQTADPDETAPCDVCDGEAAVTLSGADVDTVDFGYRPVGYGTIGDTVWADDNGDGIQNGSEVGLPDITVLLYEDSDGDGLIGPEDALVVETVSAADGHYQFDDLPAGDYLVYVDAGDANIPLDAHGQAHVASTPNAHSVALAADEAYEQADLGFTAGGTIGDFIWQDNDGDGTQDAEESGIEGVSVSLYRDDDGSGEYSAGDILVGIEVTDAAGYYEFNSLEAGDYVVLVDDAGALAGFQATGDPDEAPPCTVCDNQSAVSLSPGQIDRSRDFGYQPPGAIGDFVWLDVNGDGIQDSGEPGLSAIELALTLEGGDVLTTVTDSDGFYSFGDLPDGTHVIEVNGATLFAGALQTGDPDEDGACDKCDGAGTATISGGNSDFTLDFGYTVDGAYSISGKVFFDTNQDGSDYHESDEVYAGAPLMLWADTKGSGVVDTLIATTASDETGSYTFTDLPDGLYTVATDSSAEVFGEATLTTVAGDNDGVAFEHVTINGDDVTSVDFGFHGPTTPTAISLAWSSVGPLASLNSVVLALLVILMAFTSMVALRRFGLRT